MGRTEAASLREEHLSHEASIKTIGVLNWMGGILFLIVAIFIGLSPEEVPSESGEGGAEKGSSEHLIAIAVPLGLAVLQFLVGSGLRKFNKSARSVAGLLYIIGLLGFPLGTLISAYFLYLLFGAKGRTVFSDAYKEAIRQTPEIKYKRSKLVWIILLLAVLLIVVFIAWGVYLSSQADLDTANSISETIRSFRQGVS